MNILQKNQINTDSSVLFLYFIILITINYLKGGNYGLYKSCFGGQDTGNVS
jgi:hypothetical protein